MIKDLIALAPSSKVWIYPAHRELSYDELDAVRPQLFEFLDAWSSHNKDLVTYGNIFHRRFLALFVDETQTYASGCSVDKSVHFVEAIGAKFGLDFFDRLYFQGLADDAVFTIHSSKLNEAYARGQLNDATLFFDHLVKTKEEFLTQWLKPLKRSWHYRFINSPKA